MPAGAVLHVFSFVLGPDVVGGVRLCVWGEGSYGTTLACFGPPHGTWHLAMVFLYQHLLLTEAWHDFNHIATWFIVWVPLGTVAGKGVC